MAISNYIEAFNNLAKELADEPKIALLGYHTFAGLTPAAIQKLEEQYNCQLDETIHAFYSQTNGLQLRWMLRSNPHYNAQKYPDFQPNTAPVDWNYASDSFEKEDACLMIFPLEMLLRQLVPPDVSQREIYLNKKIYNAIDFYANIRPFDAFSYYCKMALFLRTGQTPVVLMGDEQGTCFTDSRWTNFETYLDFVITSKAICSRRKEFWGFPQGHKECGVFKISDQHRERWTLEMLFLAQKFPLADQIGNISKHLQTAKMQERAKEQKTINLKDFEKYAASHQQFLDSLELDKKPHKGEWSIVVFGGRSLAVYESKQSTNGQQLIMDMTRLDKSKWTLEGWYLPYTSWCGMYAPEQNFSKADLSHSVLIDANLEQAVFDEANLEKTDFSRSNLRGASFVNANLQGADFENCDLTGANFRGAILVGSQFKGAVLRDVKI